VYLPMGFLTSLTVLNVNLFRPSIESFAAIEILSLLLFAESARALASV